MAKISARGDSEQTKWRKPNGALIVHTKQGRLLAQLIKGDGYKLVTRTDARGAEYYANSLKAERV